jgi:small subunit ribosomal protein S15
MQFNKFVINNKLVIYIQVIHITYKILNLIDHLKKNRKDFSSRLGLIKLSNRRKRLLRFIFTGNLKNYFFLKTKLNIK